MNSIANFLQQVIKEENMKKRDRYMWVVLIGSAIVIGFAYKSNIEDEGEYILEQMNNDMAREGSINLIDPTKEYNEHQKQRLEQKIKSLEKSIETSEKMIGMKTVNQDKLKERINAEKIKLENALNELSELNN
jgi:predicted adenine nucleotide alpha hydrolase (AANH) superfamily ATPase